MDKDNYNALQETLGIAFHNRRLLRQAFVHRSYLNEVRNEPESNERLEFLGDSILSFVISDYLYHSHPQDSEGDLTNLRAFIVKTKSLAEASRRLNLGEYLLLSKGEDQSGGRSNPQLLANIFESLIGAIFLDQGLETTKKVISNQLLPLFEQELQAGPPKDAKSALQEVIQIRVKESPHYRILQTTGPDHAKEFTVGVFMKGERIGEGRGSNKQEAEEEAAANALKRLPSD